MCNLRNTKGRPFTAVDLATSQSLSTLKRRKPAKLIAKKGGLWRSLWRPHEAKALGTRLHSWHSAPLSEYRAEFFLEQKWECTRFGENPRALHPLTNDTSCDQTLDSERLGPEAPSRKTAAAGRQGKGGAENVAARRSMTVTVWGCRSS